MSPTGHQAGDRPFVCSLIIFNPFCFPYFRLITFHLTVLITVNVPQAVGSDVKDEETDVGDVPSPASPPSISLLSPKAMETAGRIIRFEEEQRAKAKVRR